MSMTMMMMMMPSRGFRPDTCMTARETEAAAARARTVMESVGVGDVGVVAEPGVEHRLGADSDRVRRVRLESAHLGDRRRADVDAAPALHVVGQRQLAVVDAVAGDAVERRRRPRHLHRRRRRPAHLHVARRRYRRCANQPANTPYSHTYYYWYSITHSLFHSRLKSFLFCKSSLPQPFLFLL